MNPPALPEVLAEHVRQLLFQQLQEAEEGSSAPPSNTDVTVEGIHPGEVRFVEALRLRVPERLEGATLVARGDVFCDNDLYNAAIIAGGDVRVAGWCSHSTIVSLRTVELHSALYSSVFARVRVQLHKEARFSILQAAEVAADEAVLIGGQVVALEHIRVRQLRWAFGDHAIVLSIGMPYLQQLEQQYWREQLRQLRQRLQDIQRELEYYLQLRRGRPTDRIRELQHEYLQLQGQLHEIERRSYGLEVRKPTIEVREDVPVDTIVAIHGVVYRVPSELLAVRFSSDGMRIVLESIPESDGEVGDRSVDESQ